MQIENKLMKLATIQITLNSMAKCLAEENDNVLDHESNAPPSEWAITAAVNDLQSIIYATEEELKASQENVLYGVACTAIGSFENGDFNGGMGHLYDLSERLLQ